MSSEYPMVPRVMAGAGGVAAGLYFGAALPGVLLGEFPLTAYTMMATVVPLVFFLLGIALFPAGMQRLLSRWTKLDLRDGGHVAAALVMAGTLYFVLGYGSLVNGAYAYETEVVKGNDPGSIDGNALFIGLLLNVAILILPPLFYVSFVGGRGPGGALEALGLHERGAARAIGIGFASALAVLVLIAIASLAIDGLQVEVPENERALDIARSVTVLGAIGLAIGSSVSEEIFFRGFLQPRIGLIGQAVFFAAAHLSYVNTLEIVVTFALAIVFGLIYRATGNLLAPIAGHFLFNLLMLLAGIYAPEAS